MKVLKHKKSYEFQTIVYDDFMGVPLKVTFLNDRWWVTTEGAAVGRVFQVRRHSFQLPLRCWWQRGCPCTRQDVGQGNRVPRGRHRQAAARESGKPQASGRNAQREG